MLACYKIFTAIIHQQYMKHFVLKFSGLALSGISFDRIDRGKQ